MRTSGIVSRSFHNALSVLSFVLAAFFLPCLSFFFFFPTSRGPGRRGWRGRQSEPECPQHHQRSLPSRFVVFFLRADAECLRTAALTTRKKKDFFIFSVSSHVEERRRKRRWQRVSGLGRTCLLHIQDRAVDISLVSSDSPLSSSGFSQLSLPRVCFFKFASSAWEEAPRSGTKRNEEKTGRSRRRKEQHPPLLHDKLAFSSSSFTKERKAHVVSRCSCVPLFRCMYTCVYAYVYIIVPVIKERGLGMAGHLSARVFCLFLSGRKVCSRSSSADVFTRVACLLSSPPVRVEVLGEMLEPYRFAPGLSVLSPSSTPPATCRHPCVPCLCLLVEASSGLYTAIADCSVWRIST